MNQWNKIWENRSSEIVISDDIFDMFCKLKKADGFDTQEEDGYYEGFFREWNSMADRIFRKTGTVQSVYEVGCGSGVNLYLFQKLKSIKNVGGCDYSNALLQIAEKVLVTEDLQCKEADDMPQEPMYDLVMADSVFQYFQDASYGMRVLEKMWNKAKKMVVITEIHDEEMKEAHLNYRRLCVKGYDEKYEGLDKTFYTKEMFLEFARNKGAECTIIRPENTLYWNNPYVFDCYMSK